MTNSTEQSTQKFPCDVAHKQIMGLSNLNYSELPNVYKTRLADMETYGKTHQLYYTEMSVEKISEDCLKQVIGKDGCYFKLTTENYDIDFIWHDRENHKIKFWGPVANSIKNAFEHIDYRIRKHSQ